MGPLEGIRVVELGVWIAGPAAGGILADWGADVLKIEPPGIGDPARLFQHMLGADLPFNPPFEMDNRSKRSIGVDLAKPAGRALAGELITRADVFVTNVRPAALARLGLDAEALLARHPRLVYGLITGYGTEGAEKDKAAYDIAGFWARSGIAHMLTQPGSHPPFQRGGMGDHGTGMVLAGAISAALVARARTGKGQLVSTSLYRQGLYTLSFDLATALRLGTGLAVAQRAAMGNPCINNYRAKDGKWFWVVGLEADRHWPPLCRAVSHPEWTLDARFATARDRAKNAVALIALLDAAFAEKTRAEWAQIFDAIPDMWWAPVQDLDEVIADPQARAAGGWCEVPDAGATATFPATPADFAGTPWAPRWMAPARGQHGDQVLRELGKSDAEIAALRASGAVA
ncbi:MAG TPA: CoA transferase [Myxococcota bacterium]|nr:CoA transferase [Myxococcota bacterium]